MASTIHRVFLSFLGFISTSSSFCQPIMAPHHQRHPTDTSSTPSRNPSPPTASNFPSSSLLLRWLRSCPAWTPKNTSLDRFVARMCIIQIAAATLRLASSRRLSAHLSTSHLPPTLLSPTYHASRRGLGPRNVCMCLLSCLGWPSVSPKIGRPHRGEHLRTTPLPFGGSVHIPRLEPLVWLLVFLSRALISMLASM